MATERQDRARKLDEAFTRVGFPSGRHGDVRERAELVGANIRTMRSWLDGTRPAPNMIFATIKMFETMSDQARREYRDWARKCADRKDYAQ